MSKKKKKPAQSPRIVDVSDEAALAIYANRHADPGAWSVLHSGVKRRVSLLAYQRAGEVAAAAGGYASAEAYRSARRHAEEEAIRDAYLAECEALDAIRAAGHETIAALIGGLTCRSGSTYGDDTVSSSYWGDGLTPADDTVSVRISDHKQKVGGGFHAGNQERMGDADVSIDPSTWKGSLEATVSWAKAKLSGRTS